MHGFQWLADGIAQDAVALALAAHNSRVSRKTPRGEPASAGIGSSCCWWSSRFFFFGPALTGAAAGCRLSGVASHSEFFSGSSPSKLVGDASSDDASSGSWFEHNVWNPLLEMWAHFTVGPNLVKFLDGSSGVKVALTCHFGVDVFTTMQDLAEPARRSGPCASDPHPLGGGFFGDRVLAPCRRSHSPRAEGLPRASFTFFPFGPTRHLRYRGAGGSRAGRRLPTQRPHREEGS